MRSARSIVFSVNGQEPGVGFSMPDVKHSDPIGAPVFPSLDYFQRPDDIEPGQKMLPRLNPDHPLFAQVFGYVAPKGQCILDVNPDECWLVPPSPTNYEYAHQGSTLLKNRDVIATANIGGGAGHAGEDLGWRQVPIFYENTSYQLAAVRYGEDDYGIYGAGVLRPEATWGRGLEMMRSATSGDWRWVDELNAWDFMGSCLVNLPGFPLHNGQRVVRRASATPLGERRAMLVTFGGARDEGIDDMDGKSVKTASGGAGCSCNTPAASTAAPETTPTPADNGAPALMIPADQVQSMIASAIEANNSAWEERFTAVAGRLDVVEPIVLSVLDNA